MSADGLSLPEFDYYFQLRFTSILMQNKHGLFTALSLKFCSAYIGPSPKVDSGNDTHWLRKVLEFGIQAKQIACVTMLMEGLYAS